MFGKPTIRKRVMAHLETLVEKAQKACDDEITKLEVEFEQKKIDVTEKHVQSILGKII